MNFQARIREPKVNLTWNKIGEKENRNLKTLWRATCLKRIKTKMKVKMKMEKDYYFDVANDQKFRNVLLNLNLKFR